MDRALLHLSIADILAGAFISMAGMGALLSALANT
jgi:hypothetical protein